MGFNIRPKRDINKQWKDDHCDYDDSEYYDEDEECKEGDIVRVFCIGWGTFDNQLSKIVEKNDYGLIKVKSENGHINEFVRDLECQVFGTD